MIYSGSYLKEGEMEMVVVPGKRVQYIKYKTVGARETWESEVHTRGQILWFLDVGHSQA